MTNDRGEDLGHGVYVSSANRGEVVVVSPRLRFGWRVAAGRVPGTAVVWRDRPFEVASRTNMGSGHQWTLRPWDDAGAMRDVYRLDSEAVGAEARRAAADRQGGRNRLGTLVLLPLLGLAPASVQKQWYGDWLFPAELATWVSSMVELLGGGLGVVQALALAFGGDWFLPPLLRFMTVVGPLMCIEAIGRMILVAGDQEPVGSLLGLPFKLLERAQATAGPTTDPELRLIDDQRGVLEVVSPVNRIDWGHDGVLPFRDRWYGLDRVHQEGRHWVYRFTRCEDRGGDERVLRLRPPAGKAFVAPRQVSPPPSILRTTLVTAAVTLGPGADQERWAGRLGMSPRWLTFVGAGAELIGGLTNLGRDATAGGVVFVVLDLFLVVEGSVRFVSALGGRPMGSVFGWALRPLYRSSLPP